MNKHIHSVAMTATLCAYFTSQAPAYERDIWKDVGCQLLGEASTSACWSGALDAYANGNVYNDKVHVEFQFTEHDNGLLIGRGRARMSHKPGTMPGGCIFTRTQDPEEFDVTISGQHSGEAGTIGSFDLEFSPVTATYTISTKCPNGSGGSGSTPGMDAFMGGMSILLHPAKIVAHDGGTVQLSATLGGISYSGSMEIFCETDRRSSLCWRDDGSPARRQRDFERLHSCFACDAFGSGLEFFMYLFASPALLLPKSPR